MAKEVIHGRSTRERRRSYSHTETLHGYQDPRQPERIVEEWEVSKYQRPHGVLERCTLNISRSPTSRPGRHFCLCSRMRRRR